MINLLYALYYKVSVSKKDKNTGSLAIKLANLSSTRGVINVSLHKDNWEDTLRQEVFPFTHIVDDTLMIDDLPYGDYAIRVFHDENCNGIVDKNYFGYTIESIGYSGEYIDGHTIPTPQNSLVRFDSDHRKYEIKMRKPKA